MKRLLITVSALALLTAPAMAQSSNSTSAAQAAARASGGFGFSGGNSLTNNFGGSKIPNNTPDVITSPGSVSGSDCQLPGFALGGAIVGNGAAVSLPGGTDEECKSIVLASFYAKLSVTVSDPREARTYRQTATALTCQVPRMKALPLCAGVAQPVVVAAYTPAAPAYTPAVAAPAPATVTRSYSYAELQAQGAWYCDEPGRTGYAPAVSVCSAWRLVQR